MNQDELCYNCGNKYGFYVLISEQYYYALCNMCRISEYEVCENANFPIRDISQSEYDNLVMVHNVMID